MKVIITLLIMIGGFLCVCFYFLVFSLFLKEEEKCLTIPYGSMFIGLIILIVMIFLEIYNSL